MSTGRPPLPGPMDDSGSRDEHSSDTAGARWHAQRGVPLNRTQLVGSVTASDLALDGLVLGGHEHFSSRRRTGQRERHGSAPVFPSVPRPGTLERERLESMTLGSRFASTMEAARRGDEAALTDLYVDVNPLLLRFLRAREPGEAEDLASEVWLRLSRLVPSFKGDEPRWLGLVFLVARRCLNDHWKRQRRRKTEPVPLDELTQHADRVDVEAAGLESVSTAEAIRFVTGSLKRDQADVLLLRMLVGLSVEEVASAIGRRPGHVRVLQHRAVASLRARLAAGEEGAGTASVVTFKGTDLAANTTPTLGELQ